MLVPNLAGVTGEVVLPILNNRLSLVGDFSQLPVLQFFDPFLDDGESFGTDGNSYYQYYSGGINYYFGKKYARGWYLGASYLKTTLDTQVGVLDGKADMDAAALRVGMKLGRKWFMFGFELGAGVPFGNLEGTLVKEVEGGEPFVELVDENIPVIPILNVTAAFAF